MDPGWLGDQIAADGINEINVSVMGGNAHLVVVEPTPAMMQWAAARLRQLEARWSRFRADSEISRLNRGPQHPTHVSADTFTLVSRMIAAWTATDGAFDPTVHDTLVRLGYDRTFADTRDLHPDRDPARHVAIARTPGCAGIILDPHARTVLLPVGVRLDPGGIGKGLAADFVATELVERGAAGACVNVGGDIRVTGKAPSPHGWAVSVEDPYDHNQQIAALLLRDSGIASSSVLQRRWGADIHHVIDPNTATPTASDVCAVSVVAQTAADAEILTTTILVNGLPAAVPLLTGGAAALVTRSDRSHQRTVGWPPESLDQHAEAHLVIERWSSP